MPTQAKPSGNMTKHLTKAQRDARQQAEEEILPPAAAAQAEKPAFLVKNKRACTYWNQILKRTEGLALLDDLDSEMLAGYCSMLARRDETLLLVGQLMDRLGVAGAVQNGQVKKKKPAAMTDEEWEASAAQAAMTPEELIEAAGKLDALTGKLQALERSLLQYAEKLGLTPSGRVRLAQKRAQAVEAEPDSDLFGD